MKYLLLDDEERAVNLLKILLQKSPYISEKDEIITFTDSLSALHYLENNTVNIIFLDIEMPVLTGLDIAKKLEFISDATIIFVTAYPQYSLNAWDIGARGYLLKPFDKEQLNKILQRIQKDYLPSLAYQKNLSLLTSDPKPHIRCFPDFEMLVDNSPVLFKSRKAKELLAFLVYNRGNWVTIDKIIYNILENGEEISSKNYCRTLTHRLKTTLENFGCENLLKSEYGKLRVDTSQFSCDYYDYLDGKYSLFQGEFLEEYEWAEPGKASMWYQHNPNRILKK